MTSEEEDEQYDDVPLHHKRPFGSGLTRKPIAFVPASDGDLRLADQTARAKPSQSVGDLYLSMVLPKDQQRSKSPNGQLPQEFPNVCTVCKAPLTENPEEGQGGSPEVALYPKSAHESSLAHQVCLVHSHPPSALDRSRMGLNYLESHGWDPDSRAGLGTSQQGIKFPLKAKPKDDTLGIGLVFPKDAPKKKEKTQLLDAGRVRKMAQEEKKKTERLRQHFYSNQDLEKYLGPGHSG